MAVLTLQELKSKITDRIHDGHDQAINGLEMQEILHDIVDSLNQFISDYDLEQSQNYYVDSIVVDPDLKTITLTRAGGIEPESISASLDLNQVELPSGVLDLPTGTTSIVFDPVLEDGTQYEIDFSVIANSDGSDIGGIISNLTVNGFDIEVTEASKLTFEVVLK